MFGLPSFTKLLVLAAIVLAVWYGFKFVARLDAARKLQVKERRKQEARRPSAPSTPAAEDMVACPACTAYVPAVRPSNCGRADCPY